MAILHVTAKTISRGKGRSAVAAAAYRSGTRLRCARTGLVADYRRRHGVRVTRVMVPGGGERDREDLWNAAEAAERRCNSTLAREFELALPAELTPAEQEQIVIAFANALIARYSVAVDWAIHEPSREGDQRNVHAHVMITTRTVDAEGIFGEKVRVLDAKGTGPAEIIWIRELVASLCNDALAAAGCMARVDPRSHADRGLIELPGSKLGVASTAIERRTGAPSERRLRQASERAELEEAIAAAVSRNGAPQNADNNRNAEIVGEHGPDRYGQSQAGVPSPDAQLEKLGAAGFAWQDVGEVGLVAPAAYAPQPSDQRAPSNPRAQQTALSDIRSGEANKRNRGAIRRARRSAIVLKPTILPYTNQFRDNPVSGKTSPMARDEGHRAAGTSGRDLDAQRLEAERPAAGSTAEGVTTKEEQVLEREVLLSLRSRFMAEAKMLWLRGLSPPSSENAFDEPAKNVADTASAHASASYGTVSANAKPSPARTMTVGVKGRRLLDCDVAVSARAVEIAIVTNFSDPNALRRDGAQALASHVTEDERKLPPRIEQSNVTSDDNSEATTDQSFGGLKRSGNRAPTRDLTRVHSSPKPADPDQPSLRERSSGRRRRQNSCARPLTNMPRSSFAAVDEPMRRALLGVTNLSTAPDGGEEFTQEALKATVVEDPTAKVVAPCSFENLYAVCVELSALLLRMFQSHRHEPALLAILEATQNAIEKGSCDLSTSTALLAARLRKDIVAHTSALASVSVEQAFKRVSSIVAATNASELERLLRVGHDRIDAHPSAGTTRKIALPPATLTRASWTIWVAARRRSLLPARGAAKAWNGIASAQRDAPR